MMSNVVCLRNVKYILCIFILVAFTSSASAKDKFKYTDQNGFVYWLDDKSQIPPPIPIQFKYVDSNGMTIWVDDIKKIPREYSNIDKPKEPVPDKSKSVADKAPDEKKKYSTKIKIVHNTIIVPVVFRNKGRKVKANMILDTGASVTTLYTGVASKLNLNNNKVSMVRSISANGSNTPSFLTKIDYIEVGDKILSNPEIIVMPVPNNIGADGLLGNSYLKYFNFTIDYENQLLQWN